MNQDAFRFLFLPGTDLDDEHVAGGHVGDRQGSLAHLSSLRRGGAVSLAKIKISKPAFDDV
jgi:hypothetical protein